MLKKLGGMIAVCCLAASFSGIVSMTVSTRAAYADAIDPCSGFGWGKPCSGAENGGYQDCNTCCKQSCGKNCLGSARAKSGCAGQCALSCPGSGGPND